MFPLADGEKITVVLPVKEFSDDHYVFMATTRGTVKKTRCPTSPTRARPASSPWIWTMATT